MKTLEQHLNENINIDQSHRWGKTLVKYGEEVCTHSILAMVSLLPKGGVKGVAYTYNHFFDNWLKNVIDKAKTYLEEPLEQVNRDKFRIELDLYLTNCLPITQPEEANMVETATDWPGVKRLVKARWYNKGYVTQHRIALALKSILDGEATKYVPDIFKCMSTLQTSTDPVKEAILNEVKEKLGKSEQES